MYADREVCEESSVDRGMCGGLRYVMGAGWTKVHEGLTGL